MPVPASTVLSGVATSTGRKAQAVVGAAAAERAAAPATGSHTPDSSLRPFRIVPGVVLWAPRREVEMERRLDVRPELLCAGILGSSRAGGRDDVPVKVIGKEGAPPIGPTQAG